MIKVTATGVTEAVKGQGAVTVSRSYPEHSGLACIQSRTVYARSEQLQLSNFGIVEDRESRNFELTLVKLGQLDPKEPYFAEGWKYEIDCKFGGIIK